MINNILTKEEIEDMTWEELEDNLKIIQTAIKSYEEMEK